MKTEPNTKKLSERNGSDNENAPPKLTFNPDKYREDLSDYDYTPEQENQMLQALWDMMTMMVDLGWGADSVHILLPELFEKAGADSGKLLQQNISETLNPALCEQTNEKETKND